VPTNQVLKLVSVRAPEPIPDATDPAASPLFRRPRPTRLHLAVAALDGQPDARSRARALATELIGSDRYAPSSRTAGAFFPASARIAATLAHLPAVTDGSQEAAVVERELGKRPARLVNDRAFRALADDLWDSLDATVIVPEQRPQDRDHLVQAVRVVHLVEVLADRATRAGFLPVQRLLSATPVVPPELFPRSAPRRDGEPNGPVLPRPADDLLATRARLQLSHSEVERLYRRNRANILSAAQTAAPVTAIGGPVSGGNARGDDGTLQTPTPVLRGPKPAPDRQTVLWRLQSRDLTPNGK
jgi:hypothetical protein